MGKATTEASQVPSSRRSATFVAPATSLAQRTQSQSRSQSTVKACRPEGSPFEAQANEMQHVYQHVLIAWTLLLVNLQALNQSGLHTLRALNSIHMLPVPYPERKKCFKIFCFQSSYYLCCFFQVKRYLVITILLQFALPTLFWMPTPPLPQPVLPPMLRQLLYIGLRQGEKMRKHAWPHAWEWRPSGGSQRWITAVVGKWRRRAGASHFLCRPGPYKECRSSSLQRLPTSIPESHGRHRRSWRSSE